MMDDPCNAACDAAYDAAIVDIRAATTQQAVQAAYDEATGTSGFSASMERALIQARDGRIAMLTGTDNGNGDGDGTDMGDGDGTDMGDNTDPTELAMWLMEADEFRGMTANQLPGTSSFSGVGGRTNAGQLTALKGKATYNGNVQVGGRRSVPGGYAEDTIGADVGIRLTADFVTDMIGAELLIKEQYSADKLLDTLAPTSIDAMGMFSSYGDGSEGFDGAFYGTKAQAVHGTVATDQIFGTYGATKPAP